MHRLRETLVAYPGIAELLAAYAIPGTTLDRTREHLAAILRSTGLSERDTVEVLYALLQQLIGAAMIETQRASGSADHEAARHAALAVDEYPVLVELSAEYARVPPRDGFELALELLIDGLRRKLEPN
jgi:hypothetical protein